MLCRANKFLSQVHAMDMRKLSKLNPTGKENRLLVASLVNFLHGFEERLTTRFNSVKDELKNALKERDEKIEILQSEL